MPGVASLSFSSNQDQGSGGPMEDDGKRKRNGQAAFSTILVVEDEVLTRLSVAGFLRDCGYRVLEAGHAQEAQAVLRSAEIVELMFSDIDLGSGLSGLELATWTRENFPAVRIILTSGGTLPAIDAANAICDRPIIAKPYSYLSLADEIRALLGKHHARD